MSQCYVIDAKTKRGDYSLWIDPQHGYNIARMEVRRDKGDTIYEDRVVKVSSRFVLKNVRFEQIGDTWVPMEGKIEQVQDDKMVSLEHRRTQVLLNPDHSALCSFCADDIPDGTKVIIPGSFDQQYTWQKGKAVTKNGENVEF